MLIAALLGLSSATAASMLMLPATAPFGDIDAIARAAGFGITQVSVTGHRFTLDSDVFRALALEHASSQLSFDAAAARARLEALPWVAGATIKRAFPDGLTVTIAERRPFAVWHPSDIGDGHAMLVDAAGRELGAVGHDDDTGLPVVVGGGAGARAGDIMRLVAEHPVIAERLAAAHRIADRRWRLALKNGRAIDLPADGAAAALARLVRLTPAPALAALLDGTARDGSVTAIDLRTTEHMVLRRSGTATVSAEARPSESPVSPARPPHSAPRTPPERK